MRITEYNAGRRLLFAMEDEYRAALAVIEEDGVVKIYQHGGNRFDDRRQFPYFIYVTRNADGRPLGDPGRQYLQELEPRVAARLDAADQSVLGRAPSSGTALTQAVRRPDDHGDGAALEPSGIASGDASAPDVERPGRSAAAASGGRLLSSDAQVSDDGLLIRRLADQLVDATTHLVEIESRLDRVVESINRGFAEQQDNFARYHEKTAFSVAEGLAEEETKRIEALEVALREARADRDRANEDSQRLRVTVNKLERRLEGTEQALQEARTRSSEADFDLESARGPWKQEVKDIRDFLVAVGHFDHHEFFWHCVSNRIFSSVSLSLLTQVLEKLRGAQADAKPLKRQGHRTFYELHCSLADGSTAGRVYFAKGARITLLGFGDKDTQDADLDRIFADRK